MARNVALIPNFSMRSYTRDLWLLTRDGHYTQLMAIAKYWSQIENVKFYMIVPPNSDIDYSKDTWFEPIIFRDYGKNIAEQRKKKRCVELLRGIKPDMVITGFLEFACKASVITKAPVFSIHSHGPLWTQKYLLENSVNIGYSSAVFYNTFLENNGVICSDSLAAKALPLHNFTDDSFRVSTPSDSNSSILVMSRLTDKTRFDVDKLVDILKGLSRDREILITNPSEGPLDLPFAKSMEQKTKSDFLSILDNSGSVILPYSHEVTYSTSFIEALARKRKVITFKLHQAFTELNTPYSIESLDEIVEALNFTRDASLDEKIKKYLITSEWVNKLISGLTKNDWTAYREHYVNNYD